MAQLVGARDPVGEADLERFVQPDEVAADLAAEQHLPERPHRTRHPVDGRLVPDDVGPVDHRPVQHDAAHPVAAARLLEGLQHDRTAHRPPEEDQLLRAPADGVRHRRVDVAPLVQTEPVAPVEARGRVGVVAVADDQRGDAELVQDGDGAQGLLARRAAAVHQHRPALAVSGGHDPCGVVAELACDPDVLVVQAERSVGGPGEVVAAPAGRPGRQVALVDAVQLTGDLAPVVVAGQHVADARVTGVGGEPQAVPPRRGRPLVGAEGHGGRVGGAVERQHQGVVGPLALWRHHAAGEVRRGGHRCETGDRGDAADHRGRGGRGPGCSPVRHGRHRLRSE